MQKSRTGCLVINSVGIAPLHQILTAPAKWRWEVTARFCYCHWMAIDVKQRSLCKPHTHLLCSTLLFWAGGCDFSTPSRHTREVQSPQAGSNTTSKRVPGVGLNAGLFLCTAFSCLSCTQDQFLSCQLRANSPDEQCEIH